ncbi:MAG: RiPP maturation radical SAM C-methyltransferase, partial [Myxococcales bacterium]
MKRVALVSMPFGTTTRPAIGISLLKAELEREGVPCDLHYLNLALANRVGIERYERICNVNDTLLAEYVFAKGLFGERIPTPEAYASEILVPSSASAATRGMALAERVEVLSSWVQLLIEHATQFLDSCMHTIDWGEYALVGFTTTFHQTLASIALATRIKQRWPQAVTVFGGANCESEMGQALHRLFPVIDFVCSGEADYSFPRLARQVVDGAEVEELPGVLRRRNGASQLPKINGEPVKDMDALPYPNYDDYVSQRASLLGLNDPPELLVETARGCWWGKKSHCTFCGLNGETMEFRAKSQARALAEITELAQRYGASKIASVDNIIAMDYFTDLLPELAARKIGLELVYETKANLRRSQVK